MIVLQHGAHPPLDRRPPLGQPLIQFLPEQDLAEVRLVPCRPLRVGSLADAVVVEPPFVLLQADAVVDLLLGLLRLLPFRPEFAVAGSEKTAISTSCSRVAPMV